MPKILNITKGYMYSLKKTRNICTIHFIFVPLQQIYKNYEKESLFVSNRHYPIDERL